MLPPVPQVGDTIFVDDTDVVHQTYIRGGMAVVSALSFENGRAWVCVAESPGGRWAWDYLGPMQAELSQCYGAIQAGKYVMRPEDAVDAEPKVPPDCGGIT